MKCFACGSTEIITTKEYDLMCCIGLTTLCTCDSCGEEWYDDSLIKGE